MISNAENLTRRSRKTLNVTTEKILDLMQKTNTSFTYMASMLNIPVKEVEKLVYDIPTNPPIETLYKILSSLRLNNLISPSNKTSIPQQINELTELFYETIICSENKTIKIKNEKMKSWPTIKDRIFDGLIKKGCTIITSKNETTIYINT